MKKMLKDSIGKFKAKIDKKTGFLIAPVVLARVGVQSYLGSELGLKGRDNEKINVFRSPEQVFDPDSVAKYVNLVVSDEHPTYGVDIYNVKKLQDGQVSQVEADKERGVLRGVATITGKKLIDKVLSGQIEVSVGYDTEYVKKDGVYDGKEYEFIQTQIEPNHLAVVRAGRCGPDCKITLDKKNNQGVEMLLTIDGIGYEVAEEPLAVAIKGLLDAKEDFEKKFKSKEEDEEELKKAKEEAEKKEKDAKAEKKKAVAEKDAAIATADSLKSAMLKDADISKLVAERANVLVDARAILTGDELPTCDDCPEEIKAAVVNKVLPDMVLKGKSNDYVSAAYDIAIEKFKKTKDLLDAFGDDVSKSKAMTSRDSARKKYMKDSLNLEV